MVDERDSISGKPPEVISEKMIKKLIVVKEDIIRKYEKLKEKSKLSHTLQILDELIQMERKDIEILESADSSSGVMYSRRTGNEDDFGMLDHIVSLEENPTGDDPKSILAWSISKSDAIYKMSELLAEDYESENIRKLLLNIAESEKKRKNRLTILYDELINKNDW